MSAADWRQSFWGRRWLAYRLRWKRREFLWRAIRARRELRPVADRTDGISQSSILAVCVVRNEAARLPEFLTHYRGLGVDHFLFVDNGSNDGGNALLAEQPDVSLWQTNSSYRQARFGMDWAMSLLMRHGHGHWCLTVDADELLVYPHHDTRDLKALTAHLDASGAAGMGAFMLDLYPKAPLGQADAAEGAAATMRLPYFDPGPYDSKVLAPRRNRWVQGGVRRRVFFADQPRLAPTLNKLPLIKWHWRYAYVNSTHSALPPRLNDLYEGPGDPRLSGVLLHTKFLPDVAQRATEELARRQHFADPDIYASYHRSLSDAPVLWYEGSRRYEGWSQLVDLGLMGCGDWPTQGVIKTSERQ